MYVLNISRILTVDILVFIADIPPFALRIENVDITGFYASDFFKYVGNIQVVTSQITGDKKQSEERVALFDVRVSLPR